MIVECQACHTRFRVDESRIQGRGARMRCRKCGEAIIVMKDPGDSPAPPPKNLFDLRSVLRKPEGRAARPREHPPEAQKPPSFAAEWTPEAPPEPEFPTAQADAPRQEPAGWKVREEAAEVALREEAVSLRANAETSPEPEYEAEEPEPETPPAHADAPEKEPEAAEVPLREEAVSLRADAETSPEPEHEAGGTTPSAPEEEPEAAEPELPAAQVDAPREEPAAWKFREEPEHEADGTTPSAPEEEPEAAEPELPAAQVDAPREEPAAWEAPAATDRTARQDLFIPTEFPRGKEPHPAEERPFELLLNDADSLDFLKEDSTRAEADFDISGNLRYDPSAEEEPAKTAPAVATRREPPEEVMPDRLEAIQRELQEIGGGSPDVPETPPPPAAAVPSVPPVRKIPARPAAAAAREVTYRSGRPAILTLLLLFLGIAGGGAYLGFTPGGQENLRRLLPLMESLWLGGEQTAPRYSVGNLIGYYEPNAKAGKLFVIKGMVTNQGRKKRSGIRVEASLFDRSGQPISRKTAFAGNVLPGEDLRTLPEDTIEKGMANRWGDRLANLDVAPGKSIPFMVVFFDAPEGIEEYRTEARDVE